MTTTAILEYSNSATSAKIERLPTVDEKRTSSRNIFLWIGASIALISSAFFGLNQNPEIGLALTGLALLPLALLILISLLLAPRSEVKLPLRLLALIWGGAGATSLTFLIVGLLNSWFGPPDMNTTVVVQAAVVEEFCKAIFLVFLFLCFKSVIRTPLAGAVLGILVGAGFAFIENIMYFSNAYLQGGWPSLWMTVAMRAGVSFFLHPVATLFTGLFIGYIVSERAKLRIWSKLSLLNMGLLAAMTIHGLWNGMASLTTDNSKWAVLYVFFWIPLLAVITFALIKIRGDYKRRKTAAFTSAAQQGYIQMKQVERILDRKTRKALYKGGSSDHLIQWEYSLLKVQFWNDSISMTNKEKKIKRLGRAKTKEMMALSEVVRVV